MAFHLNSEDDSLFDPDRNVEITLENGAFNHKTFRVKHGDNITRFSVLTGTREPGENERLVFPWVSQVKVYNVMGSGPLFEHWSVGFSKQVITDALTFLENTPYHTRKRPVSVLFGDPRYLESVE